MQTKVEFEGQSWWLDPQELNRLLALRYFGWKTKHALDQVLHERQVIATMYRSDKNNFLSYPK